MQRSVKPIIHQFEGDRGLRFGEMALYFRSQQHMYHSMLHGHCG